VFGGLHRSRVPLLFSNDRVLAALLERRRRGRELRFLDAGCGIGSVLVRVRRERPLAACTGVESAPLPALIARLRTGPDARCRVSHASFWCMDLSRFDLVYA
jgi:trans-aconitate methyltransferase